MPQSARFAIGQPFQQSVVRCHADKNNTIAHVPLPVQAIMRCQIQELAYGVAFAHHRAYSETHLIRIAACYSVSTMLGKEP